MSNYKVSASPFSYEVSCLKHRMYMKELRTGLLEQKLWYCSECKRPYELKPVMLRKGTYDQEEVQRQVKETQDD